MTRLLFCALAATACSIGPKVKNFAPIHDPAGITASVARGRTTFTAELLAVTDTALLLLNTPSEQVLLVPYGATTEVSFPNLPASYSLQGGRSPVGHVRDQLRLWSRFPAGVSATLLQQLLSAYGQDSLVVLAP